MGLRSQAFGNTIFFCLTLIVVTIISSCSASEFDPETAEIIGEEVAELTLPPSATD